MKPGNSVFRDHLFRDKVAFVTGGGSGICQRIAERLAQQGAKVALTGRTQEKLDRAAAGIREAGGELNWLRDRVLLELLGPLEWFPGLLGNQVISDLRG